MAHHITKLSELKKELDKAYSENVYPDLYFDRIKSKSEFIRDALPPLHSRIFMMLRHLPKFIAAVISGKPTYNYGFCIEKGQYISNHSLESCMIDMMMDYAKQVFAENGFHDKSNWYIRRVLKQRYTDRASFVDSIIFFGREIHDQLKALEDASVMEDVRQHLHIDHAAITSEFLSRCRKHAKNIVAVMDCIC